MIKIEMIEKDRECAKRFEQNLMIEVKGSGDVIATQIKRLLDCLDEAAHEPFMTALEHFFVDSFDEDDSDDNDE